MLNENRFLDTFRGHNIRPICNSTFYDTIIPLGKTLHHIKIDSKSSSHRLLNGQFA